MERKDEEWHKNDINDEYQELLEAKKVIHRMSEMSDIVYTVTRTRWDGYQMAFPIKKHQIALGTLYMFPKITGRWLFFKRAGKKAGAKRKITEVRNPDKTYKLHIIAKKYDIDAELFTKICQKQRKHWLLLK